MKLEFKDTHISINQFDNVDIKDFSVITGLNGSGKTHLFEAIMQGKVKVEHIDKARCIYYNYNDFTIHSPSEGTLKAENSREKVRSEYIKRKIQKWGAFYYPLFEDDAVKTHLFRYYIGNSKKVQSALHNYIETAFPSNIEDFIDANLPSSNTSEIPQEILALTLKTLIDSGISITDLKFEFIMNQVNILESYVKEKVREDDQEHFNFIEEYGFNLDMWHLNSSSLDSFSMILDDLENEQKEYIFIKEEIQLQKSKESSTFDEDTFIAEFGHEPIYQINKVLETYDCNGYKLIATTPEIKIGVDKKDIHVKINLKNEECTPDFKHLSSGEKTLIALALAIYKVTKVKVSYHETQQSYRLSTPSTIELRPSLLLLDEIDASLHPSMMKRLVTVVKDIFVDEYGCKVIIATHSPATVAFAPDDSVYLMDRNRTESILTPISDDSVLEHLSFNEINFVIFDIPTEQYHSELYEKLLELYAIRESKEIKRIQIKAFDVDFFQNEKSEAKSHPWVGHPNEVSKHTFVRNQIHHRAENGIATDEDLRESINKMRTYISNF